MPERVVAEHCVEGDRRELQVRDAGGIVQVHAPPRRKDSGTHPWTDATGRTGILVLIRDLTVLCRNRRGPAGRDGYGGLVGADPAMSAELLSGLLRDDPAVTGGKPAR